MSETRRHKRIGSRLAVSLAGVAFGLWIWFWAREITAPIVVDPVGPAFWPAMLGIGIALLSVIDGVAGVIHCEKAASDAGQQRVEGSAFSTRRFAGTIVLLILYFVGIQTVGYYAATPIFVFCLLYILNVRSPKGLIGSSLALVVLWSGLFHFVLGVPLPTGELLLRLFQP